MSEPTSPYWLASASGLNAAENTGSNSSSLPPLPIHLSDYFTNPDYLKPTDEKEAMDARCPPEWQPPTSGVPEAYLQPVTERISDVYGTDQHVAHQFSQSFNVDTTSYNHSKQFIDRQPDGQIQSIEWQPLKNEVPEAYLQSGTGRMPDFYGAHQYTAHQFSQSFNFGTTSINHSEQTNDRRAADHYQPTDFQWQTPSTNVTYPQAPPTFTTPGYPSLPPQSVVRDFCKPKKLDDLRTQKKPRLKFEQWQLDVLEDQFAAKKHVTRAEKRRLAEQLNLEPIQVLNWFMNRRQLERRRKISQQRKPLPNGVSGTQESFPMLMNNQHLPSSSNVSYPQYNTPSSSSPHSSLSTQPNLTWFEELETYKEHDGNDFI
ncbi:hypothetical protein CAEBREN_13784 [Caenorhabditis brenneri]|uniref:Homeobox domain-containing protein n=1 Tax=Caenorhabditis brenneri TaxID=135651 RepID=G0NNS4_CAEBE|nr:hypothetical protein CAEBREN_13784 [Caenorhabditis brenneri]